MNVLVFDLVFLMKIQYNSQELVRFKEKSGGKNQSDFDGFYKPVDNLDGHSELGFFVKAPSDQRELFAEAFAGALLTEFMKRELIPQVYHASLIVAQAIRLTNDTPARYGLIQPMVSFIPLYEIIGTASADGSDRSELLETFSGAAYYSKFTHSLEKYFGAGVAFMCSLLLSAHSVHSGNVVVLKQDKFESEQIARLDFGDAFRYLAHSKNNDDILYAYENRGVFNYKSLTKDYFLNYKKIPGLFPAIAQKAKELNKKLNEKILLDIVNSALASLPEDLINQQTKNSFAKYACMDSFKQVTLGPNGNGGQFAEEMAEILGKRLHKITQLTDLEPPQNNADLYSSVIVSKPPVLSTMAAATFSSLAEQWHSLLTKSYGLESINIEQLNFSELAHYFNAYLKDLVAECEQRNLWEHAPQKTANFFVSSELEYEKTAEHGHAFIAQYKEGMILRRLFSLDPQTLGTLRFKPYEAPTATYVKQHPNSPWVKLYALANAGLAIFSTLRTIHKSQQFAVDEAVKESCLQLKEQVGTFLRLKREMDGLFNEHEILPSAVVAESAAFYSIDDNALNEMSGDQLATICLEELNPRRPTSLIVRILKNEALWLRLDVSLKQTSFTGRLDNPQEKIACLYQWREVLHTTTVLHQNNELTELSELKLQLKEMSTALDKKAELERQIDALNIQIDTMSAESLRALELHQQNEQTLQKQLKLLEAEHDTMQNELQKLSEQLEQAHTALSQEKNINQENTEASLNAQKEIELLEQKIAKLLETSNSTIAELELQLHHAQEQHVKEKETLRNKLDDSEQLRTQTQTLVQELTTQLNELQLQDQDQRAELELFAKQLRTKEEELSALHTELVQHRQVYATQNETLQQQIVRLESTLEERNEQLTHAQEALKALDEQLKSKDPQIKKLEMELVQQKQSLAQHQQGLRQQINHLVSTLKERDTEITTLHEQINEHVEAQKQFHVALQEKNTIQFARTLKIAPVINQLAYLQAKLKDLDGRKELKASQAMAQLIGGMEQEIKGYIESDQDEQVAVDKFKRQSQGLIETADKDLGEHRQKWKYVLANLSLAVLLVGVGYLACMYFNKRNYGHYTFFSNTQSQTRLMELQDTINAEVGVSV